MELRVSNAFSSVCDIRTESENKKEPAPSLEQEKQQAEEDVRRWAAKVAHLCQASNSLTASKTSKLLREAKRSQSTKELLSARQALRESKVGYNNTKLLKAIRKKLVAPQPQDPELLSKKKRLDLRVENMEDKLRDLHQHISSLSTQVIQINSKLTDEFNQQRTVLRGQYKIRKMHQTLPENLVTTMAEYPYAYHLFKKREFKTKCPFLCNKKEDKMAQELSECLQEKIQECLKAMVLSPSQRRQHWLEMKKKMTSHKEIIDLRHTSRNQSARGSHRDSSFKGSQVTSSPFNQSPPPESCRGAATKQQTGGQTVEVIHPNQFLQLPNLTQRIDLFTSMASQRTYSRQMSPTSQATSKRETLKINEDKKTSFYRVTSTEEDRIHNQVNSIWEQLKKMYVHQYRNDPESTKMPDIILGRIEKIADLALKNLSSLKLVELIQFFNQQIEEHESHKQSSPPRQHPGSAQKSQTIHIFHKSGLPAHPSTSKALAQKSKFRHTLLQMKQSRRPHSQEGPRERYCVQARRRRSEQTNGFERGFFEQQQDCQQIQATCQQFRSNSAQELCRVQTEMKAKERLEERVSLVTDMLQENAFFPTQEQEFWFHRRADHQDYMDEQRRELVHEYNDTKRGLGSVKQKEQDKMMVYYMRDMHKGQKVVLQRKMQTLKKRSSFVQHLKE